MSIKKRYVIPLFLFVGLYGITQLDIFSFKESPKKQIEMLQQATGKTPTVACYRVEQQQIQYTHIGDQSLPLIIFVHGSPGSASAYLDYLKDQRLLQKAQLIAVDRPGFGNSNFGRTETGLDKQAKAFLPLLEKYNTGNTILVGHSFGGPVIAKMAMDFPNLVSGLVIVAGSIDPDLEPKTWWRKLLNWRIIRWLLPDALRVCNQEILPLEGELRKMLPFWKNITAPVTVIQGEADNLVPKGNADFAKKMLVNSEKVTIDIVKDGNHFILWSLQDRIVDAILKFM